MTADASPALVRINRRELRGPRRAVAILAEPYGGVRPADVFATRRQAASRP